MTGAAIRRPRLTLRRRVVLVAALASVIGSGIVGVGLAYLDARQTRQALRAELTLIATSVAWDARSSMMFDDRESADEALAALRAHPELLRAVILDTDGETFATVPPDLDPGWRPAGDMPGRMTISVPIQLHDVPLGTLMFEAGEKRLVERRGTIASALLVGMLVGLIVTVIAASMMHRVISRPLRTLAASAARLRATPGSLGPSVPRLADDELGDLTDEINGMLDDLRARESALREAKSRAESEAERAGRQASEAQRAMEAVREETAARRSLQEQLQHSQRMELMGQMAGGVAHDVNNALTVIVGWADLARAGRGTSDDVIENILAAAEQGSRVVRQLLAFSRKQLANPERVDANATARRIQELAGPILGESIDLHCELDPARPELRADPGQLEQVLMNLVVNARDAMDDGGRITLRTFGESPPDDDLLEAFGAEPALRYAEIVVEDDGPGISHELQERIFEPFFTTKEIGRGTGLGLAVCYGIVKAHGGVLALDSEPGRGSRFRLFLPHADESLAQAGLDEMAPATVHDGARILIVEDESMLRRMLAQTLRTHGYEVTEAEDGREALELIESADRFDLVISDVRMPNLGGAELQRASRALRPGLPFLLISGYHEEQLREVDDDPSVRFIAKPFRPAELRLIVGEMLGTGRPIVGPDERGDGDTTHA